MACNNIRNIIKECFNNVGGIYEIYLIDQDNVESVSIIDNEVIDLTTVGSEPFMKFDIARNTGNYTEVDTIDLINGSSYVVATINLIFKRREALKSRAIKILGEGQRYLAALVKDANGKYWYFSMLQLSSTGEGSGTAKADGSKYSVVLVGETNDYASEVDEALALELINGSVGYIITEFDEIIESEDGDLFIY